MSIYDDTTWIYVLTLINEYGKQIGNKIYRYKKENAQTQRKELLKKFPQIKEIKIEEVQIY